MEPDRIIPIAVLVICTAIMWWQAVRANRDADRAEAAAKRVSHAETRILAARMHMLRAAKEITAHVDRIRQNTERTVYTYGPDGETNKPQN